MDKFLHMDSPNFNEDVDKLVRQLSVLFFFDLGNNLIDAHHVLHKVASELFKLML